MMNDADIINALNHCTRLRPCEECPLYKEGYFSPSRNACRAKLMEEAFDIINRQKAEIEELNAECEKQYEQAKADILGNMADGGTSCHWCMNQHRSKAIKEFTERLKEKSDICYSGHIEHIAYRIPGKDLDSLVKEMTKETP